MEGNGTSLLTEALMAARYNETVFISTGGSSNDNNGDDICLVPTLDENHGGVQWNPLVDCNDEKDDASVVIRQHLQTKEWIFPMLNDRRRNYLYEKAICAACHLLLTTRQGVSSLRKQNEGGSEQQQIIHVLDVGSGTGLLAMMAARFLQQDDRCARFQVTSMEMATAMAAIARQTVAANGFSNPNGMNRIEVLTCHSGATETVVTPKADLMISELLETGLLAEGILPAVRDAWKRHLSPSAVVLPQKARVFALPVAGTIISTWTGPHFHHNTYRDNKSSSNNNNNKVRLSTAQDGTPLLLEPGGKVTIRNAKKLIHDGCIVPLTAAPVEVVDFDFTDPAKIPSSSGRTVTCEPVPVATEGELEGILVWWDLDVWPGLTYSLNPITRTTTSKHQYGDNSDTGSGCHLDGNNNDNEKDHSANDKSQEWQDHWHCTLHIVDNKNCHNDLSDENSMVVKIDDMITLQATHDDLSLSVSLLSIQSNIDEDDSNEVSVKRAKLEPLAVAVTNAAPAQKPAAQKQALISPDRAKQLNDLHYMEVLKKACAAAVGTKGKENANVLDVSDFGLCAMIAAVEEGAVTVRSLESSSGLLPIAAARVAQIGNNLPLKREGGEGKEATFEILQCHAEHLTLELLGGTPVDIILAEPYYEVLEGWHLQESLNFYYTVRSLRKRGLLTTDAFVVPAQCRVLACGIECRQLRGTYCACGDREDNKSGSVSNRCSISGFDHSSINCYGDRFDEFDLSLPMWQYDYKKLTGTFELAVIPFAHSSEGEQTIESVARTTFLTTGVCDALLVWLEYGFDTTRTSTRSNTNSTGMVLGDGRNTITTDGSSHRQLIRMLKLPEDIRTEDVVGNTEFVCRTLAGGLQGHEDHQFYCHIERAST